MDHSGNTPRRTFIQSMGRIHIRTYVFSVIPSKKDALKATTLGRRSIEYQTTEDSINVDRGHRLRGSVKQIRVQMGLGVTHTALLNGAFASHKLGSPTNANNNTLSPNNFTHPPWDSSSASSARLHTMVTTQAIQHL